MTKLATPFRAGALGANDKAKLDDLVVVGPSSATDSAVAQFDGTTGKLVKDGPTIGSGANQIVQRDASGRLTGDGSALTGISSAMDLINETTVSSPVASVAWTGLDTSTYKTFMVQVIGASHNDGSNQYFYMQFSPDSGSTWRTTGYQGQTMTYQGPSTSAITQAVLLSFYQDTSASFLNAELTVHNLGNSSIRTLAMGQSISEYVTVGAIRGASIGAGYDTAEAHDSIRIIPQGGSLDAGTYRIFGVK
jgi:hypothetical protein